LSPALAGRDKIAPLKQKSADFRGRRDGIAAATLPFARSGRYHPRSVQGALEALENG
jgi:hypothetical protein